MSPLDLRAIIVGYAVPSLLNGAHGTPGRVHSVFRRVLNVQTPAGRVVSFSTAEIPASPNNVSTDLMSETGWLDLALAPGNRVAFKMDGVHLRGGSIRITLAGATTFTPRIYGPVPISPDRIPHMLSLTAHYGVKHGPKAGFHALLPHAEQLFTPDCSTPPPAFDDDFCRLGYEHTAALVNAALAGDAPLLRKAVKGFLGLGPGLTPSGDDALAGLMIAAALTAKALARPGDVIGEIGATVTQEAPGTTTDLSAEFLRYAARGEGNAADEEVVGNILFGREESIASATARLLGFGASSGVDRLWGILVGIRLGMRL